MTDEDLKELIGPGAMLDFEKTPEWQRERIRKWAPLLRGLSDEDFAGQCQMVIGEGLQVEARQRLNYEGYVKTAACIHEARRRHAEKHSPQCEGDNLYEKAFKQAQRDYGFDPGPSAPCTCGPEGR